LEANDKPVLNPPAMNELGIDLGAGCFVARFIPAECNNVFAKEG